GLYYKPGSLKARFTRLGHAATLAFCEQHEIAVELPGKLVLARGEAEIERLKTLAERAEKNGLIAEWLSPEGITEREPHARGDAGLWVPSTGILDFSRIALAMAEELDRSGVELRLGTRLLGVAQGREGLDLEIARGSSSRSPSSNLSTGFLINCGGLFSDRIAIASGVDVPVRIVPFRGEYYRLRPEARDLVRGLIYPVPDPQLPFLGVHLHRTIDGEVFAGPNAVPAGRREGYRRRDVSPRDVFDTATWPGFWRLAGRYGLTGVAELVRSFSKQVFTGSLRRLVPEIRRRDLLPARSGVRAQALYRDGRLVDDFIFAESEHSLHVLNAPSPAATSCMPIASHIVDRFLESQGSTPGRD
ncbi:MAG: L-2-hydroxyglutarate oxidase, partial [Thermoanaerobaculia bacterium]|nr:L-2-hydroxyglutarate oxidase [Thermoanaerobaculia bacterium]